MRSFSVQVYRGVGVLLPEHTKTVIVYPNPNHNPDPKIATTTNNTKCSHDNRLEKKQPGPLTGIVTIVTHVVKRARAVNEEANGDRSGDYFGQHLKKEAGTGTQISRITEVIMR